MKNRKIIPIILSLISLLPVLTGTAFGSVIPTLKNELHLENLQVSFIMSTSTLIVVLLSPMIGKLADKVKTQKIIIILLGFYVFGAIINSITIIIKDYNFQIFLIGRLFQGIGNIGAGPIAISLVKNLSSSLSRNRNIAFIESFTSTGAVLGPIVGGVFALHFWKGLFLFDLILMLLLVVILSVTLKLNQKISSTKKLATKANITNLRNNEKVKWVAYLGGFGLMFSLIGMQAFLVDYLLTDYNVSIMWGSLIVSVHALLMAGTAAISGRFLSRKNSGKLISTGLVIFAVAMAIVGLKLNIILTALIIVISGIGCGLILPSGNILLIDNSDIKQQSFAVSLFASSRSLGVLFGSFFLGTISTFLNYQSMFIFSGMILFFIFLASLLILRKQETYSRENTVN